MLATFSMSVLVDNYLLHCLYTDWRDQYLKTETGGHMSFVNETETCHSHILVLPARPRMRFIPQDWEQDSVEFETKTKTIILDVSKARLTPRLQDLN